MNRSVIALSVLCLAPFAAAGAQYQPAPTQYTIVNEGPGQTQHFYRDGDRAMVVLNMPKSKDQPAAIHMRTIVDVPSSRQQSWDPTDATIPCNSIGTGDWGDPFGNWQQFVNEDSIPPKEAGQDTVNGMAATVYEKTGPEGTIRLWRENTYGLLVKAVMIPKGHGPVEMFETKQFTVGAPKPSAFAVPSRCTWGKGARP